MAESGTREIIPFDDCNEMAAACHTTCLSTETFINGQMVTTWLDVYFCIGHVYVTDVVNKFGQVSIWPTDGRDIFWNDHLILHLTDDIGSSLKSTWPWWRQRSDYQAEGATFEFANSAIFLWSAQLFRFIGTLGIQIRSDARFLYFIHLNFSTNSAWISLIILIILKSK